MTDVELDALEKRMRQGHKWLDAQPDGWMANNWDMKPWQDLYFELQNQILAELNRRAEEHNAQKELDQQKKNDMNKWISKKYHKDLFT
jgi:hypothetical protein